jgi:hypothetical protein
MTCNTCNSFGYLLTAPSTCSAGGERVTCPVCSPKVASDTGAGLREALRYLRDAADSVSDRLNTSLLDEALAKADAALATPTNATDGATGA